jgi:hypothetical protein
MRIVTYFGMTVPSVKRGPMPEGQPLPSKKTLMKRAARKGQKPGS